MDCSWISRTARIVVGGAGCFLGVILGLINVPPRVGCSIEQSLGVRVYQVQAISIQVEPWKGLHHVYGFFRVPEYFSRDRRYVAKLLIQGFSQELLLGKIGNLEVVGGTLARDEQYVNKAYFPTRMALWYLVTGRFGDLTESCHWWLIVEN